MPHGADKRRITFGIARLLLAAPVVLIATVMAILVLIGAPFGFAETVFKLRADRISIGEMAMAQAALLIICVIAVLGLRALWLFMRMSLLYWRFGRTALKAEAGTFRTGLWLGALPMLTTCLMAAEPLMQDRPIEAWLAAFYLSGLPLLVPIGHLWWEIQHKVPRP